MRSWLDRRIAEAWTRTEGNPLFAIRSRQLGWPRTRRDFRRYRFLLFAAGGALVVLWFVAGGPDAFLNLFYFLILLNLGLTVAGDLFYMLIPVLSIQRQMLTGQWDELRLTELSLEAILNAEHAIVELRSWRLTIAQAVARVLLTAAAALFFLFMWQALSGPFVIVYYCLIVLATVPVLIHFCMFEPTWNMQTVTRLGVTIAARVSNQTLAVLAGLAAIFALRIAEVVVTVVIFSIPAFLLLMILTGWQCIVMCPIPLYAFPTFWMGLWIIEAFYKRVQEFTTGPQP